MATANGNDIRVADLQILDDGDDERNMEYDSSGSESIVDANIEGNIIMDAEGNYYYQSSASVVKVEPLQKISGTPVKMVPAVVIPQSKRKNAGGDVNGHHDIWGSTNTNEIADATPDSLNKKYKIEISEVKILKTENDATKANETLTSEIDNQEKVYEFDENEQDPDDPEEVHNPDCESKGIIKPAKKNSSKEPEQFSCMVCTYKTNKKFLLSRHLKTHCLERPYKCEVCERGFKTNAALMNHRNIHLGRKPHACASCDKAFTTSGELVRHVRYRHTHIKPHKCTECDYSSVEMSKLRRHMRCHTGERPYQCPHCTYASPDTFKLKRHMRIHTGEKPYECDICHARFTQSNSLKHHRLIHSVSEKPVFQCHLCPTTCGRKSDLRLHIKNLHNSDQPLPCKRCGKELPDRYTYKLHIKTHDGEKCFRCDYCPYASISQRHLDTHVLIHLDAKPFVCEICQSSFRQKQLYARHKRIYHSDNYEPVKKLKKDHKCPHCNKVFAFNGNLIRHMEVHDPDSHRFEELDKLKLGRLKRVQPDGSVVTVSPFHKFTRLNNESKGLHDNKTEAEQQIEIHDPNSYQIVGNNTVNYEHLPSSSKFSQSLEEKDDLIYDETEEQIEDEEMHEEEYDETEVYNEQYVYDEYECEEHIEEVQYEGEKEEINEKPLLMNIKQEKEQPTNTVPTILKDTIKTEQKTVTKIMRLENQDDQDFMIIEVLPDDEDNEEQLNQEQNVKEDVQSKKAIPFTLNKNAHKSKSNNTVKISQSLISDYFGFEENDDEDDEETKGAIKLLHMIENE